MTSAVNRYASVHCETSPPSSHSVHKLATDISCNQFELILFHLTIDESAFYAYYRELSLIAALNNLCKFVCHIIISLLLLLQFQWFYIALKQTLREEYLVPFVTMAFREIQKSYSDYKLELLNFNDT